MKKRPTIIISSLFICVILIALLTTFLFHRLQKVKIQVAIEENPTENIISYPEKTINDYEIGIFSGRYIKANLFENWEIIELEGQEGMEAFTSGTIKGLSGFEVHYNGQTVFSLKGVEGVGSNPLCREVYQFSDTSREYIDSYQNYTAAPAKVIDLTNSSYSEINLLDRRVRRVGNKLYWDEPGDSDIYFNPMCGFTGEFIHIPKLTIEIVRPNSSTDHNDLFILKIAQKHSETDLLILDQILNSFQLSSTR